MNEFLNNQLETNKEKIKDSLETVWSTIKEFQTCLKDLGLDVIDRNFCKERFFSESAQAGIPVISNGLDGARVSFKQSSFERYGIERDGFYNLTLWFTNGLEKPDNEIRQKIQLKWNELINKNFH